MTDLDVQVYKELLNAEYEKLKKASIRSPDVRLSAKQDGILTAIQLLEQAEKRKRGRASAVRRKLIDAGQAGSEGHNAGSGLAWGF